MLKIILFIYRSVNEVICHGIPDQRPLKEGDIVNLERCTQVGSRLDGHIVQGHVDQTAKCISIVEENGSWVFAFEMNEHAREDDLFGQN